MTDEQFIEANIEKPVVEYAKQKGWLVRKLQWIGRRGGNDRFFARGGNIILVEFKRPGALPNLKQKREHRKLREHGVQVFVIDSLELGYELFA